MGAIELLSAHSAEVIAICALAFTAYQAYLQRRNNLISVRPHITTFSHQEYGCANEAVLRVELMNNGLGPAFIEKFEVMLDNQSRVPHEAVDEALTDIKGYNRHLSVLGDDYALSLGSKLELLTVRLQPRPTDEIAKARDCLDRLDLRIIYRCGYGKKFTYDSRTTNDRLFPVPVN